MTLRSISLAGLKPLEEANHYKELFEESGCLDSTHLKRLELNLESALWKYVRMVTDIAMRSTIWNFGSAEEESAAVSAGKAKVAKVKKDLDSQRVLIDLTVFDKNNKSGAEKPFVADVKLLNFPFAGPVSTLKGNNSLKIATIFDVDFYVHPVPLPSPTSSLIVPAWLATTTNKTTVATMIEDFHRVPIVPWLACIWVRLRCCFCLVGFRFSFQFTHWLTGLPNLLNG